MTADLLSRDAQHAGFWLEARRGLSVFLEVAHQRGA